MAHIRVETSVPRHRKFLAAGPDAAWLWLCGVCYCQDGLTDGHIPAVALPMLGVPMAKAKRLAGVLVTVGLWEVAADGWTVHDYLDHNNDADYVRSVRESRAEGGKLGGRPKKTFPQNLQGFGSQTLPENPMDSTTETTAEAPAPAAVPRRTLGAGAMAGTLPRDHVRHVWCGTTCRVCVPEALHGDLRRKLGGDDAETRLLAFYAEVERGLDPSAPVASDVFKFWRAQFDARFAQAAKPTIDRTAFARKPGYQL